MAKLTAPKEVIVDRLAIKKNGELKQGRKWHFQNDGFISIDNHPARSWRSTVCGLFGVEGVWKVEKVVKIAPQDICKKCLGAMKVE